MFGSDFNIRTWVHEMHNKTSNLCVTYPKTEEVRFILSKCFHLQEQEMIDLV